ncbi:MAG: polysaccharide biosynthesis protein [Rhodothermales bacterium]
MVHHSGSSSHPLATSALCIEQLLDRAPASFDLILLKSYLRDRTVLLTGAGGSIGRVLAQKLLSLKPKKLILADFSEFNLFHLEQSLKKLNPQTSLSFQLIDVRDESAVNFLLAEHQPQVLFHAAAYKHVPMMEHHPVQAFQNNTLASVNLLRQAEQQHVEQFVFISTDKAVAPSSIMGTTKRFTEWYVRAANGNMTTKTVRFGNVFGSLGSVVPTFIEQIQEGGPITVTHPEMERFFMSVNDACCLILQTLLFDIAPVYTLRMDPAVKILQLAEKMIEALSPDKNIGIEFIGIRAGEKIKEQLWASSETPVPTPHKDILGLLSPASFSRTEMDERLAQLAKLAANHETNALRTALFEMDSIAVPPGM